MVDLDELASLPDHEMIRQAYARFGIPEALTETRLAGHLLQLFAGVDRRLELLAIWHGCPAAGRPPVDGGRLVRLAALLASLPWACAGFLAWRQALDRWSGRQALRHAALLDQRLRHLAHEMHALGEACARRREVQDWQAQVQDWQAQVAAQLRAQEEASSDQLYSLRSEMQESLRAEARDFQSDLLRRFEQTLLETQQAIEAAANGIIEPGGAREFEHRLSSAAGKLSPDGAGTPAP